MPPFQTIIQVAVVAKATWLPTYVFQRFRQLPALWNLIGYLLILSLSWLAFVTTLGSVSRYSIETSSKSKAISGTVSHYHWRNWLFRKSMFVGPSLYLCFLCNKRGSWHKHCGFYGKYIQYSLQRDLDYWWWGTRVPLPREDLRVVRKKFAGGMGLTSVLDPLQTSHWLALLEASYRARRNARSQEMLVPKKYSFRRNALSEALIMWACSQGRRSRNEMAPDNIYQKIISLLLYALPLKNVSIVVNHLNLVTNMEFYIICILSTLKFSHRTLFLKKKKKDVCGKQNLRKINLGDTQTIPDKFRPTTILFITTSCWKTIMHKFLSTNNSIDWIHTYDILN